MATKTFNPQRPFRCRDAHAAGISRKDLENGGYHRLMQDCWIDAGVPMTPRLMIAAAMLVLPRATCATHHTAARLQRGIVPDSCVIHLGGDRSFTSNRPEVRAHRYGSPPETTFVRGLRVTTTVQTTLDLAEELDLVDLVVLADSFARYDEDFPAKFTAAAMACRTRGAKRARRAAALTRTGVESPHETRLRLLMVLAGLPEPVVNLELHDDEGRVRYRIDLSYPEFGVAIEYDGRHHIAREDQWQGDLLRREDVEGDHWRFVVVVATDLFVTPERTLQRITRVMRDRGMHVPSLDPTWRRFFPGRSGV